MTGPERWKDAPGKMLDKMRRARALDIILDREREAWRRARTRAPRRRCWPVFLLGFMVGAAVATVGARLAAESAELRIGREAVEQWEAEREAREWTEARPDSELFPGYGEALRADRRPPESYPGQWAWNGRAWVDSGTGTYRP